MSTNFVSGFGESSKTASKVLRPPGGGSSDIFGTDTPTTPRAAKNHMASNIFGSDQGSSVKNSGDSSRRAQKNGDSYSRLFGEPERPIPLSKNHMKSSIPIGNGNGASANGTTSPSSASSTTSSSTNGHNYKNGNGKMENGSTTSSSDYQNGASRTENENENNKKSEKESDHNLDQVAQSNSSNNNSKVDAQNEIINNDNNHNNQTQSTEIKPTAISQPQAQSNVATDQNNTVENQQQSETVENRNDENSLKNIPENEMQQQSTNENDDDTKSILTEAESTINNENNNDSPAVNENNVNMESGDHVIQQHEKRMKEQQSQINDKNINSERVNRESLYNKTIFSPENSHHDDKSVKNLNVANEQQQQKYNKIDQESTSVTGSGINEIDYHLSNNHPSNSSRNPVTGVGLGSQSEHYNMNIGNEQQAPKNNKIDPESTSVTGSGINEIDYHLSNNHPSNSSRNPVTGVGLGLQSEHYNMNIGNEQQALKNNKIDPESTSVTGSGINTIDYHLSNNHPSNNSRNPVTGIGLGPQSNSKHRKYFEDHNDNKSVKSLKVTNEHQQVKDKNIESESVAAAGASVHENSANNNTIAYPSNNSRNPVTGIGCEPSNYKPRKWAGPKDGNPVTGEGYKPAHGEINTSIPSLNGANQVINKNRIPPGGFSSGLW